MKPKQLPTLMLSGLLAAGMAFGGFGIFMGLASAQAPLYGNVHQNQPGATQTPGPQNVMLLLDSSYSMIEKLPSGERKMDAAKRTVLEVLRNLDGNTRVGLRVYGDSDNRFNACNATRTLVPIADNNRMLISSKMIGIRPTGATPISLAITRSLAEDFNNMPGTKTIILISDGIETCGEDPCDVAVRMQRMGVDVKMNVIGFGLNDYAATKQLRCVALATKGRFYSANTAAELANSLNQAMAAKTNVQATIVTPAVQPPPLQPAPNSPPPPQKPVDEPLLSAPVFNPANKR